jgi:hypothetical protein
MMMMMMVMMTIEIQLYVVLDKEKPYTGSIRGLNLAAVKPTTVQLTRSDSEWLN